MDCDRYEVYCISLSVPKRLMIPTITNLRHFLAYLLIVGVQAKPLLLRWSFCQYSMHVYVVVFSFGLAAKHWVYRGVDNFAK